MTKWPNRKEPTREGNGVFSPFSRQAKAWEPHAQQLRALVGCGQYEILDPYKLAPKVQLTVFDGGEALRLLPPDLQAYLRTEAQGHWSGGVFPFPLPRTGANSTMNGRSMTAEGYALTKVNTDSECFNRYPLRTGSVSRHLCVS
jgi:hypothetical protein